VDFIEPPNKQTASYSKNERRQPSPDRNLERESAGAQV